MIPCVLLNSAPRIIQKTTIVGGGFASIYRHLSGNWNTTQQEWMVKWFLVYYLSYYVSSSWFDHIYIIKHPFANQLFFQIGTYIIFFPPHALITEEDSSGVTTSDIFSDSSSYLSSYLSSNSSRDSTRDSSPEGTTIFILWQEQKQ